MNIWFRNNLTGRYLLTDAPEGHEFEYGMISSITDGQLLLPGFCYEEDRKCLSYDISGLISLEDSFRSRWITVPDIAGLMLQLNRILEKLQNYLLTEQNLVIGRDRIFFDTHRQELKFLVHPSAGTEFTEELKGLLELMIIRADRNDTGAMRLAADLLRKAAEPDFCFGELPVLLQDAGGTENVFRERPEPEGCGEYTGRDETDEMYEDAWEEEHPWEQPARSAEKLPAKQKKAVQLPKLTFEDPVLKNMVMRMAASQAIMLAGMLAVLFLRGRLAVRHALPVYLVLCSCISLYLLIDFLAEKRRAAG